MKNLFIALFFLFFLNACASAPQKRDAAAADTLLVFYEAQDGKTALLEAVRKKKAEIVYDYRYINAAAVRLPAGSDTEKMIRYFAKTPGILSVQRDRLEKLHRK